MMLQLFPILQQFFPSRNVTIPYYLCCGGNVGALEDSMNCSEGLVLVQRASDQNDVIIGPHIRGARLRSSTSFEEVDLLLPGTAR